MSDDDDAWRAVLEDTHEAVCKFAEIELDALARRTILGLQRLSASGIYGEEHRFKSVWDEYCHDRQQGPAPALEWAWDQTIDTIIDYAVEKLPHQLRLVVSIGALYERDGSDGPACFDPSAMREVVRSRVDSAANDRKMERFYRD